jgi:hypothetical protein
MIIQILPWTISIPQKFRGTVLLTYCAKISDPCCWHGVLWLVLTEYECNEANILHTDKSYHNISLQETRNEAIRNTNVLQPGTFYPILAAGWSCLFLFSTLLHGQYSTSTGPLATVQLCIARQVFCDIRCHTLWRDPWFPQNYGRSLLLLPPG